MLAQEVRSILFTADEIQKAVTQLMMQRIRGLSPSWIDRVEVTLQDGAVRAIVHFSKELSTSRPLDAHELMTAVLLYCRQARIPLSNRAQKRLDVMHGCLSLTSALNLKRIDPWINGGTIVHAVAETGQERSPAG
jgi:hypothetical protein